MINCSSFSLLQLDSSAEGHLRLCSVSNRLDGLLTVPEMTSSRDAWASSWGKLLKE